MSNEALRGTIQAFLEFVEASSPATPEDLRTLARLLDELSLATHKPPSSLDSDYVDSPDLDYDALRGRAGRRFPEFGLYRAAGTAPDGELLVGDAIDDVADIVRDLSRVIWLWDNVGEPDAMWDFHFGFDTHWGEHLRGLQWYVHETERE